MCLWWLFRLFFVISLFYYSSFGLTYNDVDGDVKQTIGGNTNALVNCTRQQDLIVEQCYLEMFQTYQLNFTSLPNSEVDPFKMIRYDPPNVCKNFKTLTNCHSEVINDCLNFNTFQNILKSESGAIYYVSQTAFLDFYCNYGEQFVVYFECMQQIDFNDVSDTIFAECSVLETGNCDSVAKTIQCERAVFRKTCKSNMAIKSYCSYQTILTTMSGWNQCEYMPCVNSTHRKFSLQVIFFTFLSIFHQFF